MEKILRVWVKEIPNIVAQGTNYVKGDYIPVTRYIFAKVGKKTVILSAQAIRSSHGWLRISAQRLASLVGESAKGLIQEILE